MTSRFAFVTGSLVVVLGVATALVAQTKVAARDALYDRPGALGPDQIYGGVAYSAQPWPSVLAFGVIVAVIGVATLLGLIAARAASQRRARA